MAQGAADYDPHVRWRARLVACACACATILSAHDLERTRVTITFARDGSFVVDVANDLEWLKLRLPTFAPAGPKGPALQSIDLAALSVMFIDRVVLFVDGHEIRPTSAEYIPPQPGAATADRQRAVADQNSQPIAAS